MRKQIDLTTLPGWANLSSGNHTIKIKAKGTGYKESELSAGVTVSKAASTVTLEKGTYKWVDSPTFTSSFNETVSYASNNADWDKLRVNGFQNIITYGIPNTNVYVNHSWPNTAYKTITLSTDQQVSAEFYKWAITDGNLVKQAESSGYNVTVTYSYSFGGDCSGLAYYSTDDGATWIDLYDSTKPTTKTIENITQIKFKSYTNTLGEFSYLSGSGDLSEISFGNPWQGTDEVSANVVLTQNSSVNILYAD